jgi:hypothetical protein
VPVRHRSHRVSLVASLVVTLAGPGCASTSRRESHSNAPMSNVHLRNSFDTDPSIYLGRFVPRDATELDEGTAMPLTCSQFVKYRFIDGGGVKVTEAMSVNSQMAARIGVPAVADGNVSASRSREVRVEYVLTGKMVAEIGDPAAFEQCCAANPNQCTDRFIGEFLQGTGAVYREDSNAVAISGQGTNPSNGVNGSGGASREKSWTQAIEFTNPVYFAFKVTQTPNTRKGSSCGAWVDTPPVEAGYVYFVGSSREMRSEQTARSRALWNARFKAYGSVATPVQAGAMEQDSAAAMQDQRAQQWALGLEAAQTCVEVVQGRGQRYVGRVLGRLPRYEVGEVGEAATPVDPTPPAERAEELDTAEPETGL